MGRKGEGVSRKRAAPESDSDSYDPTSTEEESGSIRHQPPSTPFSVPRYVTRSSLLQQCGKKTSTRYPIRNVKVSASPSSSSALPRTGLFETTPPSDNFNLGVRLESQVQKSAASFSRSFNESSKLNVNDMPTSADLDEVTKFATNFRCTKQEFNPVTSPPAAQDDIPPGFSMPPLRDVNISSAFIGTQTEGSHGISNERRRCLNLTRSSSLNDTQIVEMLDISADVVDSTVDPALTTVQGYLVKEEVAPLLRKIFSKHGDIAKNSPQMSAMVRSNHLEIVCAIFCILEKKNPRHVTPIEINKLLTVVADLESFNLEVGWLRKRLEDILKALEVVKGYKAQKDKKTAKVDEVKRFGKELEELRNKVRLMESMEAASMAEVKEIDEEITSSSKKIQLFRQPLIDGLL